MLYWPILLVALALSTFFTLCFANIGSLSWLKYTHPHVHLTTSHLTRPLACILNWDDMYTCRFRSVPMLEGLEQSREDEQFILGDLLTEAAQT